MAVTEVDENSLEYTPTWVVAVVCSSIVFISVVVDRSFRRAGQYLKNKKSEWWPLVGGSRKIKDELMLLGLISLLLTVFQTRIGKICTSKRLDNILLPCKKPDSSSAVANVATSSFTSSATHGRRLLPMASDATDYCSQKGKVALLSVEAVYQLDVFIFVLAAFHVVLCVLKVLSMIFQWSMLEIYKWSEKDDIQTALKEILKHYENPLRSFKYLLASTVGKLFTSLTEHEYVALRQNFIAARHPENLGNPKNSGKDFQKYIMRTLQEDFEKIMRIRWYLWACAVIYLFVNVAGWNAHFWISFIPFTLMVIISIKLERMIMQLAKEVAKKHIHKSSENSAKDLVFEFSEDDFWFAGLKVVGNLLHFVLFVNSLELAFLCFIMFQYGFHSCIMGKVGFVVPRIVMGVIVQTVCSSRILPLHAIIQSQMHLKEEQSEKRKKIRKIKMHLEEYLSNKHMEMCLDDLDEIKIPLKEKGIEEEEGMRSMTWISELIDNRKEPNSPEKSPDIELASTDSGEGSVRSKVSDSQKKVSQGFTALMKQIVSNFWKKLAWFFSKS